MNENAIFLRLNVCLMSVYVLYVHVLLWPKGFYMFVCTCIAMTKRVLYVCMYMYCYDQKGFICNTHYLKEKGEIFNKSWNIVVMTSHWIMQRLIAEFANLLRQIVWLKEHFNSLQGNPREFVHSLAILTFIFFLLM